MDGSALGWKEGEEEEGCEEGGFPGSGRAKGWDGELCWAWRERSGTYHYHPLPKQYVHSAHTAKGGRGSGELPVLGEVGADRDPPIHEQADKRGSSDAPESCRRGELANLGAWKSWNLEGKVHGAQPHPFQYRINCQEIRARGQGR
jgi:hypothetical protein